MPKFSVLMPVYNVEAYIRQSIESVLNQNFRDFELIITDDCGTDDSISIAEEYAKNDPRIKIIHHEKNRGVAAARNTCLDNASGEYIMWLDPDDWMEPQCIEVAYSELLIRKTQSVWFGANRYYESTKTIEPYANLNRRLGYITLTPSNIAAFADFLWIKAYTRESIEKYHIRFQEGMTFEDGEFHFKYFTLNPKIFIIPDRLINYRLRPGSIVREADSGNVCMKHVFTILKRLVDFWTEFGLKDRYKLTILKLLQNRLRMGYGLNYSEENKKLSYELIKALKYPEDFQKYISNDINTDPLVSIVIPVYNTEKYLEECLNSITGQTYKNLEIICVDDFSNDGSADIVNAFCEKDRRVKLLKNETRRGCGGARNRGLKEAIGKYVLYVDSDDWLESDCVGTVVDKFKETSLNVIMYKMHIYWDNIKTFDSHWHDYYASYQEGHIIMDENMISNFPNYATNKGYNREFLINNNLYMHENVIYEDIEFYYKLFIADSHTYLIDKPLYVYRQHDNSTIRNNYDKLYASEDLYDVTNALKEYLVENKYMDKYKNAYLKLVCNNLNNYIHYPEIHKKLMPQMLKFLKDIEFPKAFPNQ